MQSRSVAELCSTYTRLDGERAILDARIQQDQLRAMDDGAWNGGGAVDGTDDDVTEEPPEGGEGPDALWITLEALLCQQIDVVLALIDAPASNTAELKLKSHVLETLLRAGNPRETDLAHKLSASLARDIPTLL